MHLLISTYFIVSIIYLLIDIDECATGGHNCTQNQRCVNRPGSFICECVSGYRLLNGICEGSENIISLLIS